MQEFFKKYYTEEEVVSLLQKMVAIPSHKDVEDREAAVGDFIYDYCKELGFEVEKVPVAGKRCNVYARLKGTGEGPTLLLNGHMDTVPPYNMIIEPYAGEVRDGCVWGRGTNDMKGALASMMIAMAAVKRSGIKLKGDILFTAVVGEEGESDGTEYFVVKGGQADGAIVGEPSDYGYSIGHRGLETLEIKVEGTTMHGGQALKGINAIKMAARLINRIEEELFPKIIERDNEYMGPALMNYGKIFGGDQVCTVAGECTIQLDRRYIPGETVESVIGEYQAIIDKLHEEDPKFNATITRMPNSQMKYLAHAPLMTEPDEAIVKNIELVLEEYLGEKPDLCTTRGWTDAGMLSTFGHIPTVIFGPGALKNSHTKDEHIPIEHLYNFVAFYATIAARFCGTEE
ncbi:MAG: M20 family metallopeptidase [Firmicutes bacterium]|nr:M20 family metallopeptidase [Bacillota bacterium]